LETAKYYVFLQSVRTTNPTPEGSVVKLNLTMARHCHTGAMTLLEQDAFARLSIMQLIAHLPG
jgi:hypothetical protein